MCRLSRLKPALLALIIALGMGSASAAIKCPATATTIGKTTGISADRGSGGNAQSGIFECDTLIIHSFVGYGSAQSYAFVGLTANMFVNGVDKGTIAPPNFTTQVVGPVIECGGVLTENLVDFPYTLTAADIAAGSVNFQFFFTGTAQSGADDPMGGNDSITIPITSCDDHNPCTTDLCDPVLGCTHPPKVCDDDGNLCNGPETCDPATGNCVSGPPLDCPDDGNVCNGPETCDPVLGCVSGPPLDCSDDGNVCNGPESCDPVLGCVSGPPLTCNDNNPCTDDTCDPVLGCQFKDNGTCAKAGCTPGFFKNCIKSWPTSCNGVTPSTKLGDAGFVSTCTGCSFGPGSGPTFLAALGGGGGSTICGAQQILLRAAAAAYLNACLGGYPIATPGDVVTEVNLALAGCDRATILAEATKLDGFNNLGCNNADGSSRRCLR